MSDNDRNVGKSTVGLQLKNRWRKEGRGFSLKQFARKLIAEGDSLAQEWLDLKKGLADQERSAANKQRVAAEKQASKSSKRK
ncbi:hypothetical protein EBR43_12695 [bacterium]|nr:hypothetical protein [bacterium]